MKPGTARTLIAAAIIANLIGVMVMSPTAWFGLAILGAIFAVCPAVFASAAPRISGIIVLILSVGAAVFAYPAHKKSMDQYVERAKQQAEKRKAAKSAPPGGTVMKKDEEVAGKAETTAPMAETEKKADDELKPQ
jgi:membrane protein implicated in regulation of membrane protease activity